MNLSPLDLFLIAVPFVFAWIGIWIGRKKMRSEGTAELLVMGRRLPTSLFIFSLVSSWYGGIPGVTALAFERGIFSFITQGCFWYVTYLIFAFVLIPKIRSTEAYTLPDLIRRTLGKKAGRSAALLNTLSTLPIAPVLTLAILIRATSGIPLIPSALIGLALVLSYSLTGGLRSVVFAEVAQFFALILAVLSVVIVSWIQFGPITDLLHLLPDTHLQPSGGANMGELWVWGFVAIATLVDPTFYQRALAAKDVRTAQRGVLISTAIFLAIDICTTIGALYARAILPNAAPADSYMEYASQLLPSGVKGIFFAGLFAAAMASVDSGLFQSSSMLTHDLIGLRTLKKKSLRLGMLGIAGLCVLTIPLFGDRISDVWRVLGSLSAACLAFPWLMMFLMPKHRSSNHFLRSLWAGFIGTMAGHILVWMAWTSIDPFYFGISSAAFIYFIDWIRVKA
jgi:solute:Na+ symporter, SSS family